jgi:hypothetical protein
MNYRLTALERAFELARSGQYATIAEIKKQLVAESFSVAQLTGGSLSRQLKELIRTAQAARAD